MRKSNAIDSSIDSNTQKLEITQENLRDLTRGAAILGTGGGGDPYIGRLLAQEAIKKFGPPKVIDLDELDDDATVCIAAMLGAPTVLSEKACNGADIDVAILRLSERIGKPIDAIIPAEVGGVNSTVPVVAAARLGLPLVNADGMGRAFPEVHMCTWNFGGVSVTPFVIVDEHLNSAIVETETPKRAEQLVRAVAIEMGLSCMVAGYAMSGAEAKRTSVADTLTTSLKIGRAGRECGKDADPVEALLQAFRDSPTYGYAREIYDGKLVDLQRGVTAGYSTGQCRIQQLNDPSSHLDITFQNEYLIALTNGKMQAVVPDLIMIVDRETADPVPVEALRYGQRVKVIAIAAPDALRTPKALESISPECFGLEYSFVPLEEIHSRK